MSRVIFIGIVMSLIGACNSAQPGKSTFDNIVKQHYPDATEPGAALWVWKQGEPIIEEGYGMADLNEGKAITANTHFRMASVSKQITALSIYRLIQQGHLSFDTHLSTFFPKLSPAAQEITVGQLLQHTSGIWDYESLIPETQSEQVHDADVLELIRPVDSTYFDPGSQFRYSNTGYCLLALIVQKVSGEPYAAFARKAIFKPFNMETTLIFEKEAEAAIKDRAYGYHKKGNRWAFADQSLTSATQGDGGVYTSALEYARWVKALIKKQGWLTDYWEALLEQKVPVTDQVYYSMGWFIYENRGEHFLFHSGESTGFHNIVYINPEENEAAVLFTNRDDMEIAGTFQDILQALDADQPWTDQQGRAITLFEWLNQTY